MRDSCVPKEVCDLAFICLLHILIDRFYYFAAPPILKPRMANFCAWLGRDFFHRAFHPGIWSDCCILAINYGTCIVLSLDMTYAAKMKQGPLFKDMP